MAGFGLESDIEGGQLEAEKQADNELFAAENNLEISPYESMKASWEGGWATGPTAMITHMATKDEGIKRTPEEIHEEFGITVDEPTSYESANFLANQRRTKQQAELWGSKVDEERVGSTLLPLAAGLAAGISDPATIGIGIMVATGVGGAVAAAGLATTGAAAVGTTLAVEATIELGIEETLFHSYYEDVFDEKYTWADTGQNALMSFAFMAGLKGLSVSGKKAFSKLDGPARMERLKLWAMMDRTGKKIDNSIIDSMTMEEKWSQPSDRPRVLSTTLDEVKTKKLYGVTKTDGDPSGTKDFSDMDSNTSNNSMVMTTDRAMAEQHAKDSGGTVVSADVKQDAPMIDTNRPPEGQLADDINEIMKDDPVFKDILDEPTIEETIDYLSTKTGNEEINARKEAQLDLINQAISEQHGITKKLGGQIEGQELNGKYDHDAVTVHDNATLDNMRTEGKITQDGNNPPMDRTLKSETMKNYMEDPKNDKNFDPIEAQDIDEMAAEMEADTIKAPDSIDPDSDAAVREQKRMEIEEETMVREKNIQNMEDAGFNTEQMKKVHESIVDEVAEHTEAKEKSTIDTAKEFDACVKGTS